MASQNLIAILEAKRQELGESQEVFACRFEIDQGQYSHSKNLNRREVFPKRSLKLIAEFLEMTEDKIILMNQELKETKRLREVFRTRKPGAFVGLIPHIRKHTLKLVSLGGRMAEKAEPALLVEAKQAAKEMAIWMNMKEGLEEWTSGATLTAYQATNFWIAIGRLAKACEALDHLEDYPYRTNIERSIREILNL